MLHSLNGCANFFHILWGGGARPPRPPSGYAYNEMRFQLSFEPIVLLHSMILSSDPDRCSLSVCLPSVTWYI